MLFCHDGDFDYILKASGRGETRDPGTNIHAPTDLHVKARSSQRELSP
jgi:hypothetical protein